MSTILASKKGRSSLFSHETFVCSRLLAVFKPHCGVTIPFIFSHACKRSDKWFLLSFDAHTQALLEREYFSSIRQWTCIDFLSLRFTYPQVLASNVAHPIVWMPRPEKVFTFYCTLYEVMPNGNLRRAHGNTLRKQARRTGRGTVF